MPKLILPITLSLIIVLLITSNVYSHRYYSYQYASQPKPTFPYTKFSQKPKVVRSVKIQVPKVHDVEMDKIIPSITTIPEIQNHKLQEFDILQDFDMNSLHGPKDIYCYFGCNIGFGKVIVPPLPLVPPIISPIADPFNDDFNIYMSFKEFYSWWRIYR